MKVSSCVVFWIPLYSFPSFIFDLVAPFAHHKHSILSSLCKGKSTASFRYSAEELLGSVVSSVVFCCGFEYFSFARLARRAFCFAILAAFCPFLLRFPLINSSNFSRNNFLAMPLLSANDLDCWH